jgi:type I restriction enzyme S subunit
LSAPNFRSAFSRLGAAMDAPQRIRLFLFDLAIRGALVPTDPLDEPAARLLDRIRTEKRRMLSSSPGLRDRAPTRCDSDEPFPIPPAWTWTTVAEIGFINPRNRADDETVASFVPMPLVPQGYGSACGHEERRWGDIKSGYTHFADGDVGLAKITPCFENRKSTVFRQLQGGIGAGTTELHVVRPVLVDPDYLLVFLKSPHFLECGINLMTGTAGQKRVPTDYFAFAPLPLPPQEEQHRIVERVLQLMRLCDQLENARRAEEDRADAFVAAALLPFLDPSKHSTSFQREGRFATDQLPRLTARSRHLATMPIAVLGLAASGRLVRQEASDGAVAAELEKADAVRVDTAKSDRRADAARQTLLAEDELWDLPSTWTWRALADLALFIDYRGKTPTKVESGVPLVTAKNVRPRRINAEPAEFISPEEYDRWMTRGLPMPGDVLFTTEAPMGYAAVVRSTEPFALAQRVIDLRSYGALDPEYLALYLLSPQFQRILSITATGLTAKGIKAAKLRRLPVAVPPLCEQRRIVVKAEEILGLCGRIELALSKTEELRAEALGATLDEALTAAGPTAQEPSLLPTGQTC